MANNKQKLELTWIGKGQNPKLEPRILIEDPDKSYGDKSSDNMLIHGDNLLALKALEQDYSGKIKCIYIDPPYNTGQAFDHYDDGIEHSLWLSLMKERFTILKNLLDDKGTFFCQLNDDEQAYGKVLLDEVFGRQNFLNQISVKMKQTSGASGGGEDKKLKKNIEYILIYTKDLNSFVKFNDVYEEQNLFELINEMRDSGKSWKYTRVLLDIGEREYFKEIIDGSNQPIKIYKHKKVLIKSIKELMEKENLSEEQCYYKYYDKIFRDTNAQSSIRTRVIDATENDSEFISIDYIPVSGKSKGVLTTLYYKGSKKDLIAWLRDVAVKRGSTLFKSEKIGTLWDGFPLNNLTKEGGVLFPNGKKPEALVKRILDLATAEGDFVLDSFLGSGTTCAVAQKMGRKYIGIELGNHAMTHCLPRLKAVNDGSDQGGISKIVNWKGGGGFKFYNLAPSLISNDKYGKEVINKEYNPNMLASAMCKHMGFKYNPDVEVYWKQGQSTETDYIYTTTQYVTVEMLDAISEEMKLEETLLICSKSYDPKCEDKYPSINIKKIPQVILGKCEFGKDNYDLNIIKATEEIAEDIEDNLDVIETENE